MQVEKKLESCMLFFIFTELLRLTCFDSRNDWMQRKMASFLNAANISNYYGKVITFPFIYKFCDMNRSILPCISCGNVYTSCR